MQDFQVAPVDPVGQVLVVNQEIVEPQETQAFRALPVLVVLKDNLDPQ